MKQFKLTFLLTILMSMVGTKALAHDIAVANSYGVTIYYKWANNNTELSVSYRGNSYSSYSNEYSGSVTIPKSVTYNGKTYSVTSISDYAFYSCSELTGIVIPNTIKSIGEGAFCGCTSLANISLPSSVLSIGSRLFDGCTALASVTMNSKNTSIPVSMFRDCSSLSVFNIPSTVTTIEQYAFHRCTSLNSISMPTSVVTIRFNAFEGCSNLTSITLPPSIVTIESEAFKDCTYLQSINIPANVQTIGIHPIYYDTYGYTSVDNEISYSSPFKGCSSLKSFVVDEDNLYFSSVDGVLFNKDGDILYDFPKGKSGNYTIPTQAKAMNHWTLSDCDKLTGLSLPESFWMPTFVSGTQIKTFHIGKELKGDFSTYNLSSSLPNVETITVDEANTEWWVEDGVIYGNYLDYLGSGAKLVFYPKKKTNTSFAIPEGVKYIAEGAFMNHGYLRNVTLPSTLLAVSQYAFEGCTSLATITMGNQVTYIGSSAFAGCSQLRSIDLSPNVEYLQDRCFMNGTSLKTVVLGRALKNDKINTFVFGNCTSIENIYVINNNLSSYGYYDGEDWASTSDMFNNYNATVHVPTSCLSAYQSSSRWNKFANIVGSKSVDVRLALEEALNLWSNATEGDAVGQYEVGAKDALKSVIDEVQSGWSFDLDDSSCDVALQRINDALAAFESRKVTYGINSTFTVMTLEGVNLTYKITNMQEPQVEVASYQQLSGVSSITIPEIVSDANETVFNVTGIGSSAFQNCSSLASIDIPNSVTSIGQSAFYETAWYNNQPDGLVYAGKVAYEYKGNMTMNTSITLHEGTLGIAEYAFAWDRCLTDMVIPSSIMTIGRGAFYECRGLESVTMMRETPIEINASTFANNGSEANNGRITLYVPAGCKSAYEAAPYWQDFKEIIEMSSGVTVGDLNGDGTVSITDVVLIIDVMAGLITDANQVAAADVNGDGDVTITDCVAAIDLIAAQQGNSPLMAMAPSMQPGGDYISGNYQDGRLTVDLCNENRYTAFQMVVSVPSGMRIVKAKMNRERGEEHQVLVRSIGSGQYLVAGFSLDNEELVGNNGNLLTIMTEGECSGDIVVSDVEFATADAEAWHLAGITVNGSTTGIANMETDAEQTVYDLQGHRLDAQKLRSDRAQGAKRIVIVNGKKVVIK